MSTGYTLAPLRAVASVGILLTIVGVAMGTWAGALALSGAAAGVPAVVSAICTVGGLQLIGIGVLGGYLGRAYNQSLDRPIYVVRQTSDDAAPFKTATAARANVEPAPVTTGDSVTQPV